MSNTEKIVVRVDPETHEQVKAAAEADDRTIASWMRQVIRASLDQTLATK